MDNISRENNSMLPVAGVVVGGLALILSIVAIVKVSSANAKLTEQAAEVATKIDDVDKTVREASGKADKAASGIAGVNARVDDVVAKTSEGFKTYFTMLQDLKTAQEKVKVVGPNGNKPNEPVVAGKDEYIVKAGDTSGTKIAQANGVKLADLMAVNPGVEWTKLKIGQKLKLPAKK